MRYLKWLLVLLLAALAVAFIVLNHQALSQELFLQLSLPRFPLGFLVMPTWVAIIFAFVAGFTLAVALEIGAWYQYTRTIRLQRRQIKALQDELEKSKPAPTAD